MHRAGQRCSVHMTVDAHCMTVALVGDPFVDTHYALGSVHEYARTDWTGLDEGNFDCCLPRTLKEEEIRKTGVHIQ